MKFKWGIMLITVLLWSCSDKEEKDGDDTESPEETSTEEVTDGDPAESSSTLDICDCAMMAIEKAQYIDSDPDKLAEYEDEFAPCETFFEGKSLMEHAADLQKCPEVLQKAAELSQHMDIGSFIEKARDQNENLDHMMDELQESGVDTVDNE